MQSFTGDYLQVVHGYKHVDGDGPLKHCATDPKYLEMTRNMFSCGSVPNPARELWVPYFEEIGKRTVDAAKDHDKVVLSHATYQQEPRDVVIETIVKGGVPREHITILELSIDKTVKFRYLYHRTKRQFEEQGGITMEELCKGSLEWEGEELTEEKYVKAMMDNDAKNDDGWEDCPTAKKVDVSGRDISHCDNVDKALGLTRSGEWTYQSICDEVLPCKFAHMSVCVQEVSNPFHIFSNPCIIS